MVTSYEVRNYVLNQGQSLELTNKQTNKQTD